MVPSDVSFVARTPPIASPGDISFFACGFRELLSLCGGRSGSSLLLSLALELDELGEGLEYAYMVGVVDCSWMRAVYL